MIIIQLFNDLVKSEKICYYKSMFEILGTEEFKSKYINREDCAGVNWAFDLMHGNMVFIKESEIDGPPFRILTVSQILYFKSLGTDFIVQDEDFYSFYK